MKPTLLVLAAGVGSRYGGLKQLDTVGPKGETIIDYSVYDAIAAGFGKVVFVIRPQFADEFKKQISTKYHGEIAIDHVYQELESHLPERFKVPPGRTKPWGTGHAVLVAESAVNEPFTMINADDFYGRESYQAIGQFLVDNWASSELVDPYAMVGFTLKNTLSEFGTVSRGVCELKGEYLESVTEFTKIKKKHGRVVYVDHLDEEYPLAGNELVSMNMWGFTPSIFSHLRDQFKDFVENLSDENEEFYIPTVVNNVMKSGEATVKVIPTDSSWFGITYKDDLKYARTRITELIREGVYPQSLF